MDRKCRGGREERRNRDVVSTCGVFVNFWIWSFYRILSERFGNEFGVHGFCGGSIYLGLRIKKSPGEFIGGGNLFDGARFFSGVALGSGNCEGGIQDISILPPRAQQKGEPLTQEEQFTFRSAFGELTRISRIARPEALYDASVLEANFRID